MTIPRQTSNKAPATILTLWLCLIFAISGMAEFLPHAGHHHHHHDDHFEGIALDHSDHEHHSGEVHGADVPHPIKPCCLSGNQFPPSSKPASFCSVHSPNSSKTLAAYGLAANCISGVPPPKLDVISAYANSCRLLGTLVRPDRTVVLLI